MTKPKDKTGDRNGSKRNTNNPNSLARQDENIDDEREIIRNTVRIGRRKKIGFIRKTLPKSMFKNRHYIHMMMETFYKLSKKRLESGDTRSEGSQYQNKPLTLIILNMPTSWRHEDIKNYIENECGNVESVELLTSYGAHGSIRVKLFTQIQLVIAKAKLDNKEVHGTKLLVVEEPMEDENNVIPPPISPYVDVWAEDPQGLYGLKPEFLRTLNITPPIDKWVHVFNFKCGKLELKEVFDMAGQILFCTIKHGIFKSAKVMYSHPLEAVQAVSMFNGRIFYGRKLGVTIDKEPIESRLPPALKDVGPGLGKNGMPVINIAQHYDRFVKRQSSLINPFLFVEIDKDVEEMTPEAKVDEPRGRPDQRASPEIYVTAKPETSQTNHPMPPENLVVNPINIFQAVMNDVDDKNIRSREHIPVIPNQNVSRCAVNSIQAAVNSDSLPNTSRVDTAPLNILPQNANVHYKAPSQPLVMAQNVVQPHGMWPSNVAQLMPPVLFGSNLGGPQGTVPGYSVPNMHVPNVVQNLDARPVPIVNVSANIPAVRIVNPQIAPNSGMNIIRPEKSTRVALNNIPPSTFETLYEKLSKCGQVVSIHHLHQTCVIATFATVEQAERCILMYNRFVIGNNVIEVHYV